MSSSRRQFLKQAAAATAAAAFAPQLAREALAAQPFFEISLAEWSLHKALFSNKLTNLHNRRKANINSNKHATTLATKLHTSST